MCTRDLCCHLWFFEMLYADDLVLTSETMEGLREKFWIEEEGAEGEPGEDKSSSEWGRR